MYPLIKFHILVVFYILYMQVHTGRSKRLYILFYGYLSLMVE